MNTKLFEIELTSFIEMVVIKNNLLILALDKPDNVFRVAEILTFRLTSMAAIYLFSHH